MVEYLLMFYISKILTSAKNGNKEKKRLSAVLLEKMRGI